MTKFDPHGNCKAAIESLKEENQKLRLEVDELDVTYDLRWKADMRAIRMWREKNPGNDAIWPDHADLCIWLLGQIDELKKNAVRNEECNRDLWAELCEENKAAERAVGEAYTIIEAVHDALVGKNRAGAFNEKLIIDQTDNVIKWIDGQAAAIIRNWREREWRKK